jgi:hypothetical protein
MEDENRPNNALAASVKLILSVFIGTSILFITTIVGSGLKDENLVYAMYAFSTSLPVLVVAYLRLYLDRRTRNLPFYTNSMTAYVIAVGAALTLTGIILTLWDYAWSVAIAFVVVIAVALAVLQWLPPDKEGRAATPQEGARTRHPR